MLGKTLERSYIEQVALRLEFSKITDKNHINFCNDTIQWNLRATHWICQIKN